eukprot:m.26068 g.26068  ORF g.26068 m.26068 type:complete len:79 (+) comp11655_c0_seq12:74-310(+)
MYVIVEDIEEGDKVKAEIVFVLQPMQVKHLQTSGLWPATFDTPVEEAVDDVARDDDDFDEDDPFAGKKVLEPRLMLLK